MAKDRTETQQPSDRGGLVVIDPRLIEEATKLDEIALTASAGIMAAAGHTARALHTARGILALRQAVTAKIMAEVIMPLMNTRMGFMTDRGTPRSKEKEPYHVDVVKECAVAAMLNGFMLTNNEMNIIAYDFYGTLNGWSRKFREIPGITDIKISPGVPIPYQGRIVCRVALTWMLNGKKDQLLGPDGKPGQPFPLIHYGKESVDQLIGKAKAKAFKLGFQQATGSVVTAEADEVGETPALPDTGGTRTQQVIGAIKGANGSSAEKPSPATQEQINKIDALCMDLQIERTAFEAQRQLLGGDPAQSPSGDEAAKLIQWLENLPAGQQA